MPIEVLAKRLENWLTYEDNLPDQLFNDIKPIDGPYDFCPNITTNLTTAENTQFYFGMEEHLDAVILMMKILIEKEKPCNILISSDDNLEWLLPDFMQTKRIQANLLELVNNGFTITQIMPSINHLPRYTEALQFWLPVYSTGKVTVHYYPRLRDNLYRFDMFIIPGSFVLTSTALGVGKGNDITIFSTNPQIVDAYTKQFNEYLSMCRPAMKTFSDMTDITWHFAENSLNSGDQINITKFLPPHTISEDLFPKIGKQAGDSINPTVFDTLSQYLNRFESSLNNRKYIDIVRLANPKEIVEGKISLPSLNPLYEQIVYTPEIYSLYLKNILRLMDKYENYYFIPYDDNSSNYNLFVNSCGTALLVHDTSPSMVIEMQRPELVIACYEHLVRKAEKIGYTGIHRKKIRLQITQIIKSLS